MLVKFLIIFLGALFPLSIILITNSYNISNFDLINIIIFIFILSLISYIPLFLNFFKKIKYEYIFILFIFILTITTLILKLYEINSLSIKKALALWFILGIFSYSIVFFQFY